MSSTASDGYRAPRIADERDDPRLCALARSVVMRGDVSYVLERDPSFLAMTRAQGEGGRVVVIEHEESGEIVASAMSAPMDVYLDGRARRTLYTGDLKVHPAHRAKGVAERVAAASVAQFEREGHDLAWGVVLASNRAVERFFGRTTELVRLQPRSDVTMWNVFFGARRGRVEARRARPEDAAQMVELFHAVHRERQLAPALDRDDPLRALTRFPGMRIEDYYVRERAGRIVAFCGVWDAFAIKRARLLALSRGMQLVRVGYDTIARIARRPRLPRDGEHLRFLYATTWCAERAEDLRAVLATIHDAHAGREHVYFDIAFDVRDPMARALDGFWKTGVPFRLATLTWGTRSPPVLRDAPSYFDPAIV
ncbi:GNAT family N-acetyltransferase [Sandaracinus amylolyticus]|uniref:N-acetyltransferase domain-containing protein n=1 Tax=Sandaracinus amylolyticus TaxID=927083 RepID=A0A0F6YHL3_9BACT|nr:GNAT family N-acetyltransferase [Sandaracinus amylolyticus]AKF04807.1 hypothetical protein DB32_001956 [Sandaracinus amylolyticus]